MGENSDEDSHFHGYEMPQPLRTWGTRSNMGDAGGVPLAGENIAGGGDRDDSASSSDGNDPKKPPFDLHKILG